MIHLDAILVGTVVAVAVCLALRKLYRDVNGSPSCDCGGGCGNTGQAACCAQGKHCNKP